MGSKISIIVALAAIVPFMGRPAQAEDLTLYGAGSLSDVMPAIAKSFTASTGVTVKTAFGPSGRMRQKIETGDKVDVFTSANVAHPAKLMADGRAAVTAVFARNAVCMAALPKLGLTPENVVDKLLQADVKLAVQPAKIDPLGDYTLKLYELADRLKPGSRESLQQRSTVIENPPPDKPQPPTGDSSVEAVLNGQEDAAIVYCSYRDRYPGVAPGALTMVDFPASLRVGPEYSLAVLKGSPPSAMMLALYILSPVGQKALLDYGFKPVGLPED
jgi:ABC-type molybdate transport system substrate-binding protein